MQTHSSASQRGAPHGQPAAAPTASVGPEQFAALSSIFDAAEMVLYVADMDTYELIYMNPHAERLWGSGRIGEPCFRVLQTGCDAPCEFCNNARLRERDGAAPPVVWEFQNTVNRRWYLCIDKAIRWSDGRLVRMEVAIDITERKLHDQFRDQYVGVISHDLRSPLSAIGLWAATLKLIIERTGPAEAAKPVDMIAHSVRRMSTMIEDLLETTRLESGRLQLHRSWVDLAELAATVTEPLASAQVPVLLEATGPVRALADGPRLQRVLENLIGNALRHSATTAPVRVRVAGDTEGASITVSDLGKGIAPEVLARLFQRFSRGAEDSLGLGLGLYISRLLVEQHGGRIWAESALGAGSTFGFTVPAVAPD